MIIFFYYINYRSFHPFEGHSRDISRDIFPANLLCRNLLQRNNRSEYIAFFKI